MKKLAATWVLPENVYSNQEPRGAYFNQKVEKSGMTIKPEKAGNKPRAGGNNKKKEPSQEDTRDRGGRGRGGGRIGGRGRGRGAGRGQVRRKTNPDIECFRCHQRGHIAAQCPNPLPGSQGSNGGGYNPQFYSQPYQNPMSGLNGEDIQGSYPPYGMYPPQGIPRGFNGYMGEMYPPINPSVYMMQCVHSSYQREPIGHLSLRGGPYPGSRMSGKLEIQCAKSGWGNPTMLDSGASINTVTSESMLVDIKDLPTPIEIEGVGGVRKLSRVGQWSIFGPAAVNTNIPLNIVSLSCMEKLFDVHYSQGDSYILQSEEGRIIFKKDRVSGFYILEENTMPHGSMFVHSRE